jgi:hypothetical protein
VPNSESRESFIGLLSLLAQSVLLVAHPFV